MIFANIPSELTIYIYKLIHHDLVLNLNREYNSLVVVDNININDDTIIECSRLYINLRHPLCKIKSRRFVFYFNYRAFDCPNMHASIYSIRDGMFKVK